MEFLSHADKYIIVVNDKLTRDAKTGRKRTPGRIQSSVSHYHVWVIFALAERLVLRIAVSK